MKNGFTKDLPIWSDTANGIISEASQHVGVMFNGIIYDNVHIKGMEFEDWLADMSTFYNDGQVDLLQLYRHNIITVGGIK